jgi:transcriptional regulator with XRE-family HTH domain
MSKVLDSYFENISPERKRRFDYADKIAEYLRSKLHHKGQTQKELANLLDMKASQLNRYMNGESNLNLETIAKLEFAIDDRIIMIREPLKVVGKKISYDEGTSETDKSRFYKKNSQGKKMNFFKEHQLSFSETGS